MAETRVRRAGYHHGDLPNALADAATDLARRGGPEAVVLREAARRAGVSAAAAYRHFAGHGELLQAVKRRALAALAEAMLDGLNSGGPLPDPVDDAVRRFRGLGSAYIGFALANPGLFHTAFCRTTPGDVTAWIAAARPDQILSESLDGLVAVGLLGPARRPLAPIAFWSAVHGLSTLFADGPLAALTERERAGAIQCTLDILIDGMAHPAHPAATR